MRLVLAVACALIAAHFEPAIRSGQQPSTNASSDRFNAPDVYDEDEPGVQGIRLTKEVKPNYTLAAMQEQIQGMVVMECIVERDGSVGPIRILHSLDPRHGLDSEAVTTVSQWRFTPATKDGQPVRTRIVVEMSFALRDSRDVPEPDLKWPAEFPERRGNLKKAATGFMRQTVSAVGLRINIGYPPDWQVTRTATANHLITVSKGDEQAVRSVSVFSSGQMTEDIVTPLSKKGLAAVEKFVKQQVQGNPDMQLLKVGQVWTYDRQWIWAATRHRGVDVSDQSPEEAAAMLKRFTETRVWTFTSTERGHEVRVVCKIYVPAELSKNAVKGYLRELTGDFQVILDRMSIAAE